METPCVFPFGEPVRKVVQTDRTPKRVFVLGVYASAVHARWTGTDGRDKVKALAVASEPCIFWRGDKDEAEEAIEKVAIPAGLGRLSLPDDEKLNGPSGRNLDDLVLAPLHLKREQVWLCDLVPHYLANKKQLCAVQREYLPLTERFDLPLPSVLPREQVGALTDEHRRQEILAELMESGARALITLGEEPLTFFLSCYDPGRRKRLAQFGQDGRSYGRIHHIIIAGKEFSLLPLTHPRQSGGLGEYSAKWYRLHQEWIQSDPSKSIEIR